MSVVRRWSGLALVIAAPLAFAGVGSVSLIDASGLEFFINTDVTFATSSNASGAAFNATYTQAVAATTSGGGTAPTVLSGAFNGYNSLFVDGVSYNLNGPAAADCDGRLIEFEEQTIGALKVSRKVFVPDDDAYCAWFNIVKNSGTSATTATLLMVNSLGSGNKTVIAQSSEPPLVATTADKWIVSYEDYTAGVSPDPRLAHALQGPNRRAGLSSITFTTGNGQPFWEYEIDLNPGETKIVLNLVSGQPSIDEAVAKAADLVLLPESLFTCLSSTEENQIVNFDAVAPTCTLGSSVSNPTNASTIPVTVTFSEAVTGFEKSDIVPTNAKVKNFDGNGATYTFDLIPLSDGLVSADVAEGVAMDEAGNPNAEAQTFTRTVDVSAPSATMTTTTPDPSNISTIIDVTVTFSEPVEGFTSSDVDLLHCTLEGFSQISKAYTQFELRLLPARIAGEVGADIPAGAATDEAGNPTGEASFRHTVGPGFSCLGSAGAKRTPTAPNLADIAPLGAVLAVLTAATFGRRRR